MNPTLKKFFDFPLFRWLRFAALAFLAGSLLYFAFKSYAWQHERSFVVFVIPISFIVNAVSIEIIFSGFCIWGLMPHRYTWFILFTLGLTTGP